MGETIYIQIETPLRARVSICSFACARQLKLCLNIFNLNGSIYCCTLWLILSGFGEEGIYWNEITPGGDLSLFNVLTHTISIFGVKWSCALLGADYDSDSLQILFSLCKIVASTGGLLSLHQYYYWELINEWPRESAVCTLCLVSHCLWHGRKTYFDSCYEKWPHTGERRLTNVYDAIVACQCQSRAFLTPLVLDPCSIGTNQIEKYIYRSSRKNSVRWGAQSVLNIVWPCHLS